MYQHRLEKAFPDEYARQQVVNLATFWTTGAAVPDDLDEIIFDEGQFNSNEQNAQIKTQDSATQML